MDCELRKGPVVIAEAGVNHNGSLQRALAMVGAAAKAGADYVKFQAFHPDGIVTASAPTAQYQQRATGDTSQSEMLNRLALSDSDFRRIAAACRNEGIGFMATPFDAASLRFLASVGQDYWKVASGEVTNLPLLRLIGAQRGRVIMSTGMCTMAEAEVAVKALEEAGTPRADIILLHCNTQYPTPYCDVNLRAMLALKSLGCGGVGYSDHTPGIEIPVAATALGAYVIEKHFTMSRSLPGPDHKASLTPVQLKQMVAAIRHTAEALGDGVKRVSASEEPNRRIARRALVAARFIHRGEGYTEDNVVALRPADGLSPMLWDTVMGRKAPRDIPKDSPITLE